MTAERSLAALVRESAEPIASIDGAELAPLMERVGDARLVLLGECTHGTREFYRMRTRITQALIARRGFQFVAVEADWPDAARVCDYVQSARRSAALDFAPFSRFPTWMWRNDEVVELVEWLRAYNLERRERSVGFHGLDLYSLFTSIAAVLAYLGSIDPEAAAEARARYGALLPWRDDPAAYGRAVRSGRSESCEDAVVEILRDMLARQLDYAQRDGERFFDAAQNARLVESSERYYRTMYYGGTAAWNLRDSHMFDTLRGLLAFHGDGAKGIVWEHNSHLGDARATEMGWQGEHNVGQLCRTELGAGVYIVGFGTDHGSVAAASGWDAPMEVMRVRPSRSDSYEGLCHAAGIPAFALRLRDAVRDALRDELEPERLERAIGVVYRPESERASHYFHASLPRQFDEYIWFDETNAVRPLRPAALGSRSDVPDTYPFGL